MRKRKISNTYYIPDIDIDYEDDEYPEYNQRELRRPPIIPDERLKQRTRNVTKEKPLIKIK